jgi:hypothetical protein
MAFGYMGNFAVYPVNLKGNRVVAAKAKQYGNIGTVALCLFWQANHKAIFYLLPQAVIPPFCLSNSTNC